MSILKSTNSGSYFPITTTTLKRHDYWYNCTISSVHGIVDTYTRKMRIGNCTCICKIYHNKQKNEFYTIIRKSFAPVRLHIQSENDLKVFECYFESISTGKNVVETAKQLYKTFNI
jgi:hypothetical protein